jgi:hypothetical protein
MERFMSTQASPSSSQKSLTLSQSSRSFPSEALGLPLRDKRYPSQMTGGKLEQLLSWMTPLQVSPGP